MPEFVDKILNFKVNTFLAIILVLLSAGTTFGLTVGSYAKSFEVLQIRVVNQDMRLDLLTSQLENTNLQLARISGQLTAIVTFHDMEHKEKK